MLACLSSALAVTSFLIPIGNREEEWIPLVSGFLDLSSIYGSPVLSGILGTFSVCAIVASMLAINKETVNNAFNPYLSALFFLFITLLDPSALYLSCIHPVVLLFVWGQYCFLINQKFTSMFLLSCSVLFYPQLIWALPVVLIISVFGAADIPRVAMKSLGGLLLPLLYIICFRYMMFGDASVFVEEFMNRAASISSPVYSVKFTMLFALLCIFGVALHAISYMFAGLHKNSIMTVHILRMEFMSLILGTAMLVLFWGNGNLPVNMMVALPLSLILSHYFTGNINAASARVELVLLCCAAIICRLSYFI